MMTNTVGNALWATNQTTEALQRPVVHLCSVLMCTE